MSRWYYTLDNKQRLGPVNTDQLRQLALAGAIRPEHMVMREEGGKWVSAAKVKGLLPETAALANPPAARPRQAGPAPAFAPAAPAAVSLPAPAKRRRRGPIMVLAACLALLLFLCAGGGLVGVMFGWWPKDRGDPHGAPPARRDDVGKAPDEQAGQSPEKHPAPAAPDADFTSVDVWEVYRTYGANEAAADAKYLNKRLQFTLRPNGIDKESDGYCAWQSGLIVTDALGNIVHQIKCFIRPDQASALAAVNSGADLTVRGVCAGKTGAIQSNVFGNVPTITFKDCELVPVPAGNPDSKATVSGKVTYRRWVTNGDAPVISGTLKLYQSGNLPPILIPIKADGTFSAADVPVGVFRVSIVAEASERLPGEMSKPVQTRAIPAKFNDPNTSGLLWDIKGGKNAKYFDLTD